jgi:PTH1 family peptidyl-tRNA hydrolase
VYALIGLGNPEKRYDNTRHNIGYKIVDHFAAFDPIPFKAGKGDYYYKQIRIGNKTVLISKPTTYMNLSGFAVRQVVDYFKINIEDLLVICDDFNLPFGTLRYRVKGSEGGHNGLRSIIYQLGTEDFNRLRFGIGDAFSNARSYVLDRFSKKENQYLEELLPVCSDSIENWLKNGIDDTMNKFNRNYLDNNG